MDGRNRLSIEKQTMTCGMRPIHDGIESKGIGINHCKKRSHRRANGWHRRAHGKSQRKQRMS